MARRKTRRLRWLGIGKRKALGYVWEAGGTVVAVRGDDAEVLLAQAGQFEAVNPIEAKKDVNDELRG